MNNRRQTIWLVSMLSLMVILSAYYLFTEPVEPAQNANNGTQQTDNQSDTAKTSGGGDQGVQISEVDQQTDTLTDAASTAPDGKPDPAATADDNKDAAAPSDGTTDPAAADKGKTDGQSNDAANGKTDGQSNDAANGKTDGQSNDAANGGTVSPEDETVLNNISNLKGAQYFDELQRRGDENYSRTYENLNKIVADTKNHTPEEATNAVEEMNRLEDTDIRMTSLEEKLLQDFENAVVTEEQMNFKIVVQAAKLDKKQAVKIIGQAATELKVKPARLSVEFITP